ncbi:FtsX-like permease family protein [bacterium]|nr:FtsX-like permease family protein [bacterium]
MAMRWSAIPRLAWRESRTARRRLLLYMSSISLGVAALVAIDSFAANVQSSLKSQSRTLLGGDVSFTYNAQFPEDAQRALDTIAARGTPVARVVSFGSMVLAQRSGGTRLAQVKAVGEGYPFYGTVETAPVGRWSQVQAGRRAVVDPALLIALDAQVGDSLTIGYGRFEIIGAVEAMPGDPGFAAAIGPRVYIAERYAAETQLLGFGSRASYEALVKLPANIASDDWVKAYRARLQKQNVRVVTVTQRESNLTESIGQLADFLGIVGLIALLLGGIGVASGVNAFVTRKIETVAVLRCVGATSGQVLGIYVLQASVMGFLGAAMGAVLGVAIQFGLPLVLKDFLPVDVSVALDPKALLTGLGIGVWVALVFALRPLLGLRRVSPLQALRRDADALDRARARDIPTQLVNVALVGSVLALSFQRAGSLRRGAGFAGGIAGSMVVLYLSAAGLSWLARRMGTARWPYVARQGLANLYRPGNQTRTVVLALGFGSFLVSTLFLVQANLLNQFNVTAAQSKANMILFDIQDDQRAGLDSIFAAEGQQVMGYSPIVTMKIAEVNGLSGVRWAAAHAMQATHWTLRREYRSTYRDTVVATEKIVSGTWFGAATLPDSITELSLDQDVANQLKVQVGDQILWDVQGVRILSQITSLRTVTWGRFEPNFFAVFATKGLVTAPKQFVTMAAVSADTTIARLQRRTVSRFPNVSSVDLSLVRRTVTEILEKVSVAVRFLALFSLAMGVPVLFSAVAATRRDRLHESVLLKTLGATQAQIMRILLVEYALLGALGALTGMVLSFGGAWALIHYVFKGSFSPAIAAAAGIAALMMGLAVTIGLVTSRDVFRETPMAALREN